MKKSPSSKKQNKGKMLFYATALVLLSIFIGYDYFEYAMLKHKHRYTIAYVTDFTSYVRTYNNHIHYYYVVNGKTYKDKFRSRELSPHLKGKNILIKYSPQLPYINQQLYTEILTDSINAPADGWENLPKIPLTYP
jgi:hypothetical protein